MNKRITLALTAFALIAAGLLAFKSNTANASLELGQAAPNFEAIDTNGKPVNLGDLKGKIVVLEWTNNRCPFVVKHYSTGNMQAAQKTAHDQGVEWISIVSSAPGRQGHVDAAKANAITAEDGATISAKILDESGEIGRLYGARTTPHMFVIDENGVLAYAGAIDNNSSANPKTVEGAQNYVLAAINDLKAGNPVATTQTRAYGCPIKY